MIELAEAFGKLPEEVADPTTGMSEYWWELSLVYLAERSRQKPLPTSESGGPVPEPSPEELDDKGRWFLAG